MATRSGFAARLGVCLWLASMALTGCGKDKPEEFVASGKEYLAKHEYAAAIIELKNALKKAPNNPDARYLLGVALERSGDSVSAEIELRKAAEGGYPAELVYPALGRTLVAQGQSEKALSELKSVKFGNAGASAETRAVIGETYLRLGRTEEARSAFASALDAQPDSAAAKLGLARVAAAKPDLPEAMRLVDELLAESPLQVEALTFKGDLLAAQNKTSDAEKAYEKALGIDPAYVQAHTALISLLVRTRSLDKAKQQVAQLKKVAPKNLVTSYLEALVLYNQNEIQAAKAVTAEILKVAPDHLPSLLLAGAIAHDLGAYSQAEDYLRKVVNEAPRDEYARRMLISTYLRNGRPAVALETLKPLLEQSPESPSVFGVAGEVYLANNQPSKAMPYFQKLVALDPKNASARTRLAQIHAATGQTEEAINDLELASESNANEYQADLALVSLHMQKKDFAKALAAADALLKKQPTNPVAYNVKGIVQLRRGDVGGARGSFERAIELQPTFFPAVQNLATLDLTDKKPQMARQRYEALLAKDPRNEQALLSLAELTQLTDAPASETREALDKAVTARPDSLRLRVVQISFLRQMGDRKGALAAAQQADAALPDNPQILELLGRIELESGAASQAISTFGKLSTALPKSAAPLMLQAEAYTAAKNPEGALGVLAKALAVEPGLVAAQKAMALLEIQTGRYAEALGHARAIQKELPKDALGYLLEAGVLSAQKKDADAERLLEATLKRTPSPVVVIELYDFMTKSGRASEAKAIAEKWVRDNPKDVVVLQYLAAANVRKGDFKAAAPEYKALLARQPKDVATLNSLAWSLGQIKDADALRYAEQAYSLAPDNPNTLETLGWLLVEQGKDTARGLQLLRKAASVPNAYATRLRLAQALIKSGEKSDAKKELETLVNLPGESAIKREAEKLLATL